ncbi:MAG TPA: thioredoxin domain-containing protein [Pyrinomonadaceae bacterium]|jgi:protein-disulfide isomerase
MKRVLFTTVFALVACAAHAQAQTRTGNRQARPATPATTTTQRPASQTTTPTAPATSAPQRPAATTPAAASNVAVDCGCEAKPLPEVLAIANGIQVTKSDLSQQTRQRVEQLQRDVVEARRNELNLIINTKLLNAEAKKRNLTSAKLFEQEVLSKVTDATEADAQAFYNQNKAKIPAEFNDVKSRLIAYLTEERQRAATQAFAERLRAASQVKVIAEANTPARTAAERERILAVVNSEPITAGEVEDNLSPLIYEVQKSVYDLRRSDVELKINDILLEQEAQKRKVTTKALLEAEVSAKTPTVTEAQAQTFFNENKQRINGDFTQVKPQLIQYLQSQEAQKAENAFARQLRQTATIQTFLTAPESPVFKVAIDDQPMKGNPAATVTVVEFTDYQCPSCAQVNPVLERLMTEYADRAKFVVRDYPLAQHENAFKAAEAAEAAREQGKYWEYTSILFRNQSALEVDKLKAYATQLGLDRAKFDAALDSGRFADKVYRDLSEGTRVGVNGTPTLFINGRRVEDRSYEGMKAMIEAELKKSARK